MVTKVARMTGLPADVVRQLKDEYLERTIPETINLIHQEQEEIRKRLHEKFAETENQVISKSYELKLKALTELEEMINNNEETVYNKDGEPVGTRKIVDAKTMLSIVEKLHAITEGSKTASIMDEMRETVNRLEQNQSGNNFYINEFNAGVFGNMLTPNNGKPAGNFAQRILNIEPNEQN